MEDLNLYTCTGHLGADPELHTFDSGSQVCTLRVAITYRLKDSGDWVEETMWMQAKIFGGQGAAFAKYHKKGGRVLLEGSIQEERWKNKADGKLRTKQWLRVAKWHFLSSKSKDGERAGAGYGGGDSGPTPVNNDDFGSVDNTPF